MQFCQEMILKISGTQQQGKNPQMQCKSSYVCVMENDRDKISNVGSIISPQCYPFWPYTIGIFV